MQRMVIGAVFAVLGSAAFAAQPENDMDEQQFGRYFAVISCVDRSFYDGGYDVGDPEREALMSEALAKYGLPPYDEALYQRKYEVEQDLNSYMRTYVTCSEDAWLADVAEQRGLTSVE